MGGLMGQNMMVLEQGVFGRLAATAAVFAVLVVASLAAELQLVAVAPGWGHALIGVVAVLICVTRLLVTRAWMTC